MNTALITDDCLANNRRRYLGNPRNKWQTEPVVWGIPHPIHLFNLFSFTKLDSAIQSFDQQLEKNKEQLNTIDPQDLIQSFGKILGTLLEINASSIYTQITTSNSLVIKAETTKGNLYSEVFFDEITGWANEMVVNIFNDQQLQFNSSGLLDAMILAIKQYFGNEEINYFTILNQAAAYDLSGTALATTDF